MCNYRKLTDHMKKYLLFAFAIIAFYGCTKKAVTTKTTSDYSEDLSAFRPEIEVDEPVSATEDYLEDKGPYVAPTHDINSEMSVLMDSIVSNNKKKKHLTYTIQVYIGRSREEANKARENVYRVMPEVKPELSWNAPSWKVLVGDYYDKIDAYKTLSALRGAFPGATMVPRRKFIE